jgi:hypothetical protein
MPASLIRSRAMITHAQDRHRWNEVTDGAVLQEDGVIAEIGTYEELSRKHTTRSSKPRRASTRGRTSGSLSTTRSRT